jgi:tetratricopeptide (TPR) repeat protein
VEETKLVLRASDVAFRASQRWRGLGPPEICGDHPIISSFILASIIHWISHRNPEPQHPIPLLSSYNTGHVHLFLQVHPIPFIAVDSLLSAAMFSRTFHRISAPSRTATPLRPLRSQLHSPSAQCLYQTSRNQSTRSRLHNARFNSTNTNGTSNPSARRTPPLYTRLWLKYERIVKSTLKDSPVLFPIAMVSGVGMSLLLMYVLYLKFTNDPYAYLANYPPSVGNNLILAAYYTRPKQLNPPLAIKYFKEALVEADKAGMDAYSDEILGIKFHLVEMFTNAGWYDRAAEVLETVKRECEEWVQRGRDEAEARLKAATKGTGTYNILEEEKLENERLRVLAKMVAMGVKLGELYSSDYLQDDAKAEECLTWAVETSLRESRRREKAGKDKHGTHFFDKEQVAVSLEELGSFFEKKNRHVLAAPLFLRALSLVAEQEQEAGEGPSCKQVVLMNNLAISLAQQLPQPQAGIPEPSRAAMIESARQWAVKSLDVAAGIKPPRRTEECDMGCAVATHNLGEFAEMEGNVAEARKRYEEAASLSKALGFVEGIANADEGIKRLIERKTMYDAE